jgi:ferritin
MLSKKMATALNQQILMEAQSSQAYLAMGSWAESQPGLKGVTQFFYTHSDEERMHMLKLIHFVNERGGKAAIPELKKPVASFGSLKKAFEALLEHELAVSASINQLVDLTLTEKDYATHHFLQWYVMEQMEEERLARDYNDKLEMIGDDKSGLYLFDRDLLSGASADAESKA